MISLRRTECSKSSQLRTYLRDGTKEFEGVFTQQLRHFHDLTAGTRIQEKFFGLWGVNRGIRCSDGIIRRDKDLGDAGGYWIIMVNEDIAKMFNTPVQGTSADITKKPYVFSVTDQEIRN
jgi:hypothetical protein